MRITSKGQVTIPIHIREKAGLLPNTDVEFDFDGEVVTIVRSGSASRKTRGQALVEHLRKHPGDVKMTTDEIMKLMRPK